MEVAAVQILNAATCDLRPAMRFYSALVFRNEDCDVKKHKGHKKSELESIGGCRLEVAAVQILNAATCDLRPAMRFYSAFSFS